MLRNALLMSALMLLFAAEAYARKIPCSESPISLELSESIKSEGCFEPEKGETETYSWKEFSRYVITSSGRFYKAWESVPHVGVVITYRSLSELKDKAKNSNSWIRKHAQRWSDPEEKFGGKLIQVFGDGDGHKGTCFAFQWYGGNLKSTGATLSRWIQHCAPSDGRWLSDDEIEAALRSVRFARDPITVLGK